MTAEVQRWTDGLAQVLAQARAPRCELCGCLTASPVRCRWWTPWLCGSPECEALADHVETLGDLGRLRRG